MAQSRQEIATKLTITKEEWIKKVTEACKADWQRIEETYDQLEPAADPVAVKCLTSARKSIDDIMRRSLCIPEVAVEHKLSGQIDHSLTLNEENISRLNDLRKRFPVPSLTFS